MLAVEDVCLLGTAGGEIFRDRSKGEAERKKKPNFRRRGRSRGGTRWAEAEGPRWRAGHAHPRNGHANCALWRGLGRRDYGRVRVYGKGREPGGYIGVMHMVGEWRYYGMGRGQGDARLSYLD